MSVFSNLIQDLFNPMYLFFYAFVINSFLFLRSKKLNVWLSLAIYLLLNIVFFWFLGESQSLKPGEDDFFHFGIYVVIICYFVLTVFSPIVICFKQGIRWYVKLLLFCVGLVFLVLPFLVFSFLTRI